MKSVPRLGEDARASGRLMPIGSYAAGSHRSVSPVIVKCWRTGPASARRLVAERPADALGLLLSSLHCCAVEAVERDLAPVEPAAATRR